VSLAILLAAIGRVARVEKRHPILAYSSGGDCVAVALLSDGRACYARAAAGTQARSSATPITAPMEFTRMSAISSAWS
jgi:hypothetical protein